MAKKNAKKEKNVVSVDCNIKDISDVLTEVDEKVESKEGVQDNATVFTFSELFFYKKCNEMLLNHYDNLTRIINPQDNEYNEAVEKMSRLRAKDIQIMGKIEEKVLNSSLC